MPKGGKSPQRRLRHGEARERILDAAEKMFAVEGYDNVSFRSLTPAAGVSFLQSIIISVPRMHCFPGFLRAAHHSLPIAAWRFWRPLIRYGGRPAPLESILDAFLRPAFEVTRGDRNDLFNRLRARVSLEHSATTRHIVSRAFDQNDLRFIDELRAALPELKDEDLYWRFHFLVRAMIYAISDLGQLEGLSGGKCSSTRTDLALPLMVKAFSAVFGLHRCSWPEPTKRPRMQSKWRFSNRPTGGSSRSSRADHSAGWRWWEAISGLSG